MRRIASVVSALFAALSLLLGVLYRADALPKWPHWSTLFHLVVALWVLVPPAWFSFEWVRLSPALHGEDLDRLKHQHDLTRNMWLALVAVLAALFGISIFKT